VSDNLLLENTGDLMSYTDRCHASYILVVDNTQPELFTDVFLFPHNLSRFPAPIGHKPNILIIATAYTHKYIFEYLFAFLTVNEALLQNL
jgi:hypothetical protein